MDFHLIVKDDFYPYVKGSRIEDPKDVADILDSENSDKVVRVAVPASSSAPAPVSSRFASE